MGDLNPPRLLSITFFFSSQTHLIFHLTPTGLGVREGKKYLLQRHETKKLESLLENVSIFSIYLTMTQSEIIYVGQNKKISFHLRFLFWYLFFFGFKRGKVNYTDKDNSS